MLFEVVLLGEVSIKRNGVKPQFIVIAVEEGISDLGAQPAVVIVIISLDGVGVAAPIQGFKCVD